MHRLSFQSLQAVIISLICLSALSCSDEDDRFEVVNKLRSVGVRAQPSILVAPVVAADETTQVNLTGHMLMPAGQNIDLIEAYVDTQASFSRSITAVVESGSIEYNDLGPITHATFRATATVPSISSAAVTAAGGSIRWRYGFRVRAGAEEELLVGDLISVATGDVASTWQGPIVSITAPSVGAQVLASGETPLQAQVDKRIDERVKVLWFVSSGEVKNFQGSQTTWEGMASGPQAIVFAAFPRKSWQFEIVTRTVQVSQ